MLHRTLKAIRATQLGVDNYELYCPVHDYCEGNEEYDSSDESSLSECVSLADDSSATMSLLATILAHNHLRDVFVHIKRT